MRSEGIAMLKSREVNGRWRRHHTSHGQPHGYGRSKECRWLPHLTLQALPDDDLVSVGVEHARDSFSPGLIRRFLGDGRASLP